MIDDLALMFEGTCALADVEGKRVVSSMALKSPKDGRILKVNLIVEPPVFSGTIFTNDLAVGSEVNGHDVVEGVSSKDHGISEESLVTSTEMLIRQHEGSMNESNIRH